MVRLPFLDDALDPVVIGFKRLAELVSGHLDHEHLLGFPFEGGKTRLTNPLKGLQSPFQGDSGVMTDEQGRQMVEADHVRVGAKDKVNGGQQFVSAELPQTASRLARPERRPKGSVFTHGYLPSRRSRK